MRALRAWCTGAQNCTPAALVQSPGACFAPVQACTCAPCNHGVMARAQRHQFIGLDLTGRKYQALALCRADRPPVFSVKVPTTCQSQRRALPVLHSCQAAAIAPAWLQPPQLSVCAAGTGQCRHWHCSRQIATQGSPHLASAAAVFSRSCWKRRSAARCSASSAFLDASSAC